MSKYTAALHPRGPGGRWIKKGGAKTGMKAYTKQISATRKVVAGAAVVAGTVAVSYGAVRLVRASNENSVKSLPLLPTHTPQGKMVTLYHITPSTNVHSILKTGIRPSHYMVDLGGGSGYVHLTADVKRARGMGARFRTNTSVLAVKVNRHKLLPDANEGGPPHYRVKSDAIAGVRIDHSQGNRARRKVS
jgi:hypothetical protein